MLVCEMSLSCSGSITEEDVAVIWKVPSTDPPLCKVEGDDNGEKSLIPYPVLGDAREGGMLGQVGISPGTSTKHGFLRCLGEPLSCPGRGEMQTQPSPDYRKLSSTSWCPVVSSWQPAWGSHSCSSSCRRPRGLSQDIVDDVLASFSVELKGNRREREISAMSQVSW